MRAPVGGARFAGLDRLPRRVAVGLDEPVAIDAVAPEGGAHERAAAAWVRGTMLALVLAGLPIAAAGLGLQALGHLGLVLAGASLVAACVGAGLDRWGAQASAGLEPATTARIATRAMRLQAGMAIVVLPVAGAAMLAPPAGPLPVDEAAAALALALLAGSSPRWWFTAHRQQASLRVPVAIACASALAALSAAMIAAPSVASALGSVALAFAWTPWAAWRLHRGAAPSDASSRPGALAVPWHAALRAGLPTLARRVAALVLLFSPVALAAFVLGPAAAGGVLWAGASVAALAAATVAARR